MTALLTDSEAADLLRLTSRQVMKLARRGELPSIRFPNAEVRFIADDLQQWIREHRVPADTEVTTP
jgi:excisionase family DNA binding protein